VLLGLYRACASLQFAVVLIALCAVVLCWATLVESRYGTPAAQFGIYTSWWFALLNFLLVLNVVFAAAIRFPWKRRQTGFLVTHAGIVVLLVGCFLGWMKGIHAQMPIYEGKKANLAFKDSQHFELAIGTNTAGGAENSQRIVVPFSSGPFNWDDYGYLPWFPWRLADRSQGVIYDRRGVTLEVLDYYSDSRRRPVPRIALHVAGATESMHGFDTQGQPRLVELAVTPVPARHGGFGTLGMGQRKATPQDQSIVFWMTGDKAETDAFLDSGPQEPLGPQGQVVLYARGRRFVFPADKLQQQKREPLGDTGLEIELTGFDPRFLQVQLLIRRQGDQPQPMALYASSPHFNRHDRRNGVFGSFWIGAGDEGENRPEGTHGGAMGQAGGPRIDVIQGPDMRLYYRAWKAPNLVAAAWPVKGEVNGTSVGTEITVFEGSESAVRLYLDDFVPSDKPGWQVSPLVFDKPAHKAQTAQPRARLRLTVDGNPEEFWLAGSMGVAFQEDQRKTVSSAGRQVAITLSADKIDLGFQVYLHEFRRKLDPGSGMASHYSSLVDFLEVEDGDKPLQKDDKPLQEKVVIGLNAPVDFSDPRTGRSYRLFQSSFRGPWKPGSAEFDQLAGPQSKRDILFLSQLAVNHDPGRGLKYAGSLLVVLGIGIMFYMRAYFFQQRPG